MRAPYVSVILCVYNEEKLLRSCLDALLQQSWPNERYEIIIVENESYDQTWEIAEKFIQELPAESPHVRMFGIAHSKLAVSRNFGIHNSGGELIAFLDGDAVPDSKWLERLVEPFGEDCDYVGGRIELLNRDSCVARFLQLTLHRQFLGPTMFSNQFIGCNMAFKREVFKEVSGFFENFESRGDESALRRRLQSSFKYGAASNAIVFHEQPDTVTAAIKGIWASSTLEPLASKASSRVPHPKVLLLLVERFLMLLWPVSLGLAIENLHAWSSALGLTTLAVLHRVFLRSMNRSIARGLIKEYGILPGIALQILLYYPLNIILLVGYVTGWLRYRKEDLIAPMTHQTTILREIERDL